MSIAEKIVQDLSEDGWREGIATSMLQLIELTCSSDKAISSFTDVIIQDAALASKVIEAANSTHFKDSAREPVTTVANAVLLLGMDTTRQLAMALSLMDKLFEPSQRALIHEELASAVLACSLANKLMDEVGDANRDLPEVATMVKGLGRLVTAAYAYSEYREIVLRNEDGAPELEAEISVLGASFDDLAFNAAKELELPSRYELAIKEPHAARVANLASELAQALGNRGLHLDDTSVGNSLEGIVESFKISRSKVVAMAESAMREFKGVKAALKDRADKDVISAKASGGAPRRRKPKEPSAVDVAKEHLAKIALDSMRALALKGAPPREVAQKGVEYLSAVGRFRNVLYCETISPDSFQARAGAGECALLKTRMWIVNIGTKQSLMGMALFKGVSVHLGSAREARLSGKLPDWVRQTFALAGSLLFIPLGAGTAAPGFVYCDKAEAETAVTPEIQAAIKNFKECLTVAYARAVRVPV